MFQNHAKIVQFISLANEITGRKKLQKMIFISKKLNYTFTEKYNFHIYGPYSEELTLRIEELCEMGFLQESCTDKGSYIQYAYQVTSEGDRFLETMDAVPKNLESCIDLMMDKSSRSLELVSTLLYFDHLKKEEQIEKLHIVKNKLKFSAEEIEAAYDFIGQLERQSAN